MSASPGIGSSKAFNAFRCLLPLIRLVVPCLFAGLALMGGGVDRNE
jgi:hypothetical protein